MPRIANPKYYTYDKKRCDFVIQYWSIAEKRLIRVTRCKYEAQAIEYVAKLKAQGVIK